MKKILMSALFVSSSIVQARDVVSIDTNLILLNSKAGKKFETQKEKARIEFQKTLSKKQEEVAKSKQELAEKVQKGLITEAKFRAQLANVELQERRAHFDVEEASATIQNDLKNKETELRQDIAATAQELVKSENWGVVVTKDAPFLVAANQDADVTPQVLKAFDKKYEASLAKSALSSDKKETLKS